MKYILEINEPGETGVAAASFESDSPFGTVSVGDLLNPGNWEGAEHPGYVLRVVNVEHILWDFGKGSGPSHKICVFTEAVPDSRQLRTKPQA
jgi:hypothetical protein